MKKSLHVWGIAALALALLAPTTATASGLTPKRPEKGNAAVSKEVVTLTPVTPIVSEIQSVPSEPITLVTSERASQSPVVLAQQSYDSYAPVPAYPYGSVADSAVSDPAAALEIDRLFAKIDVLEKRVPKAPDTKKGWSTPKLGGRLFIDALGVNQNRPSVAQQGDIRNVAGFSEAMLTITGNGFDSFDYKMEVSFDSPAMSYSAPTSRNGVWLTDNWVGVKNLPLFGYVRVGHFKPEMGMGVPTSTLHTPLMTVSAPESSAAFSYSRRVGIASEHTFDNDRIRLFYGLFQEGAANADRFIITDGQGAIFNTRLTATPVFENEGRKVVHIGGSYSYVAIRNTFDAATGTMLNRASASLTPGGMAGYLPATLSTGTFDCDHQNRGAFEFAYQNGRFSLVSQLFATEYAAFQNSLNNRTAYGATVEFKYFLNDAFRTYNQKSGTFGAVKMKNNFHPFKCGEYNLVDGWGAWQFVAQWGYMDLTDWRADVNAAGYQNDLVLGLNWFWNPNIRWIFEYVHSEQNIGTDRNKCAQDIFATSLRLYY